MASDIHARNSAHKWQTSLVREQHCSSPFFVLLFNTLCQVVVVIQPAALKSFFLHSDSLS